jgi:hypothetical protein
MDKKQQQQQQHPLFESINQSISQSIDRSTKYTYREVSHVWTVFKAGNLVEAEAEFPIFLYLLSIICLEFLNVS